MNDRYKIIISNKRIYKEVVLSSEAEVFRIGTSQNADLRFRKDFFFSELEIVLKRIEQDWFVNCSKDIYLSFDGILKLDSKKLSHGDEFFVKYQQNNMEVLKLSFMLDFDYQDRVYNQVIDVENYMEIKIGGKKDCDVYIEDDLIGNDVVGLNKRNGVFHVIDYGTKYGVYVNGHKINKTSIVQDYDFISIVGHSFYLKDNQLFTDIKDNVQFQNLKYFDREDYHMLYPKFNRNTRIKHMIQDTSISILDPPQLPQEVKNNLFLSLLPALGMLVITVGLRGIIAGGGSFIIISACTMSIGILTSIFTYFGNKKKYKKDVMERKEKYLSYINKKKEEIIQYQKEEKEILEKIYFDSAMEYHMVQAFSGSLFDRKHGDEDFLHIHLGTGNLPAKRKIDYKKQEKFEVEDNLAQIPEELAFEFRNIEQAPIVCKLAELNALGIVGNRIQLYEVMKNMVLDLCIRHYHTDVKLFFMIKEEAKDMISWLRWLPHFQNDLLNVRNIVCNDESKNYLFEYLYKELSQREASKEVRPHMVIFVFDEIGIKQHPLSKYIDEAKTYGVTFIFFVNKKELLLQGCDQIIQIDTAGKGSIVDSSNAKKELLFTYSTISDKEALEIATRLSPVHCEEVSLEGSLTKNISLFELLHILSVEDIDLEQRWKEAQVYKTMEAPLGVKTKNSIMYLDIHEKAHGPHGLVAGTTGSGKSEILQSYILSMATLYHPHEVSFMIIDFKGGGMVNQFRELPHLVGAITNIDGKEIDRSLKSIKAELQKRQRCFAEAEVNHIDAYIKKHKNGEAKEIIPHLIIIVDEFAELKAEQPEFMKELISAARIGRSLGVHLILATQKPAGQVNEQIWSNSKFKLCLKVQTKEDSNEVLKSPLAAEIREPGRSYFQVGNNEIFELFQSAYSGAFANEEEIDNKKEFYISSVSLSGKRKVIFQQKRDKASDLAVTQLDALVDYIYKYCKKNEIVKAPSICLPPLPKMLSFRQEELLEKEGFTVDIGVYDNPDCQYQGEANIDFGNQNTIIIGSAQFGKTNLLQTIIRGLASKYTPEELNIYIIDFASMVLKVFEGLNHCGGVVCSFEDEKLKNLFKLLNQEIETRKQKLMSIGVSSYSSYREAGYTDIPQIVLIIDNLTALKELYLQDNDILVKISREGLTVGISIIVANAQTANIGYKYFSNFSLRIALYCNDSNEYSNIFDFCRQKPANIPGRCLVEINRILFECQTYLAFEGEKEFERVQGTKEFIEEQNSKFGEKRANYIPVIPKTLSDIYVSKQFSYLTKPYQIIWGLDYANVTPMQMDMRSLSVLAITGREKSGKGNFIHCIVHSLHANRKIAPVKVAIFDDVSKKLYDLQELESVSTYSLLPETVFELLEEWEAELENRYHSLMNGGSVEEKPLLLMIIQNPDVAAAISANKDAINRYKQIVTKYKSMKVSILFSNIQNAGISFQAPEVYKMMKENKHYLVFEDINNFKVTDVPLAVIRDFKKPIDIGDAYYIKETEIRKIKTVLHTKKK